MPPTRRQQARAAAIAAEIAALGFALPGTLTDRPMRCGHPQCRCNARICRENGIDHLLTAPRSPTTTGKIERFHRSLRAEFDTRQVVSSLKTAQQALDEWVAYHNGQRPHQALGMATPAARFTTAPAAAGRGTDLSALAPDPAVRTGSPARSAPTGSSACPGRTCPSLIK